MDLDLHQYRPAEIFRLTNSGVAYPEYLFRDTLLFLLTSKVLRLRKVTKGKTDKREVVIVELAKKKPEFEFRKYEKPILRFLKGHRGKKYQVQDFIVQFSRVVELDLFRVGVDQVLEKRKIIYTGLQRHFSRPKKGKQLNNEAHKILDAAKAIGSSLAINDNVDIHSLRDILYNVGHHLILVEKFPFGKFAKMLGVAERNGEFSTSFFDEGSKNLPDLRALSMVPWFDKMYFGLVERAMPEVADDDGGDYYFDY